jgi:hypothetical protein
MAISVVAGLASVGGYVATALATGGALAFTTAMTYFAVGAGLSMVSRALMPKPDMGTRLGGIEQTVKKPAMARQLIYGRAKVGGNIVYFDNTGANNRYLHMVIAIAGHEIDAYEKVYFNDEVVWDGSYQGDWADYARIKFYKGDQTSADSDLVTESSGWNNNCKLLDTAYLYVRLDYDQEKFADGVPNISCLVRGKKVLDPRTSTTAWSDNPALCIYDYLRDQKYGLNTSDILVSTVIASANDCETQVDYDDNGTTRQHDKYKLNGVIDTSQKISTNIENMLTAMAGRVVFSGGNFEVHSGKYSTPTVTLDESMVVGDIQFSTKTSRRSTYNGVKGMFLSEELNYTLADYPAQISSTYQTEDGEPLYLDMTLPFTVDNVRAQRLAKLALLKSRQQRTLIMPVSLAGLKLKAGDTVYINNTRLGLSNAPYEVLDYELSYGENITVNLSLIETASEYYDWNVSDQVDFSLATDVQLYDGTPIPIENLAITETTIVSDDGTVVPSLRVFWDESTDPFIDRYEVQFQRGANLETYGLITDTTSETENWGLITDATTLSVDYGGITESITTADPNYNSYFTTIPQFQINPVQPNIDYTVRVRAINQIGRKSSWVTATSSAQGDQTAPSIPTITAVGGIKQITIAWDAPSDNDYSHCEIYENSVNNSSTATKIAIATGETYIRTDLDYNVTKYYWVSSVDYSGNKSALSNGVSATTLYIESEAFSDEVNNLFSEAGAYGIEPVSSLPATGDFVGQIKYDTTANALYRWTGSAWSDDIFSISSGSVTLSSFTQGLEPVSLVDTLPSPTGYTGANVVFLTSDNKLYRYNSSVPEFTSVVNAGDVDGNLSIDNFPNDVRPIERVSSLPTSGNFEGRAVFLTTDGKIYRYNSGWTSAVPTSDLSGQIVNTQIADLAINVSKIADDAISSVKLADGAVTGTKITNGSITETKISDNAITTGKIAVGAITANEIASNAITTVKIDAGAVTAGEIATNAVTSDKIIADAITAGKIATNAVTSDKITSNAITSDKIEANAITAGKIATNAITSDKIEANAITTAKLSAGAITTDKITAGAITTSLIASDAITANEIASETITASEISAGAITADKLAVNSVTAGAIEAGAISTSELASGAITTDKLGAGVITAEKIATGAIETDKIASNSITAGLLASSGVITNTAQINDGLISFLIFV